MNFAEAMPSIALEELNAAAALQTRVDRKYLVDMDLANRVLLDLPAEVLVLEMNGVRSFTYDSVYFDTPDLQSYHLAAYGRRRRYKIRTRTYVDSALSFLEVKTEGARSVTVKERIDYALEDRSRITEEGLKYIQETLTAGIGGVPDAALSPVLETAYARTTLYLPDYGSRATIDTDVTWSEPSQQGWTLTGKVVVETKSGHTAGPLDRHLWSHGVRPCRISKFATGLGALRPELPTNRWHQTLMRQFTLRRAEGCPSEPIADQSTPQATTYPTPSPRTRENYL